MKLSDHQAAFTKDLARLILWVDSELPGHRVRLREVWRPPEMQEIYIETGRSWTRNSQHLVGMAADLVLDINGIYQTDSIAYTPLGIEWERISHSNRWGGRFGDGNHFERRTELRTDPDLTVVA